jgi:phage-related protein
VIVAFYGCSFSFDGISSNEHGLVIYDFGSTNQGDASFSSSISLIEDRIPSRRTPIVYGSSQNDPLEFNLVFGIHPDDIDINHPLDRWDVNAISTWLTGVDGYRWLEIDQFDMQNIRFKCIISSLKLITPDMQPWAFSCKVTCDSPFAYTYPTTFTYSVSSSGTYNLYSESSYKGYYNPILEITFKSSAGNCTIKNNSDGGREMKFTSVPSSSNCTLYIDCETEIITASTGLNIYPYFNFKFLRLVRGDNSLTITGNCTVNIICEFPINVGG